MTKLERVLFDVNIKPPLGGEGEMRRDFVSDDGLLVEMDPDGSVALVTTKQRKWIAAHRVIEWVDAPAAEPFQTVESFFGLDKPTDTKTLGNAAAADIAKLARSEQASKAAKAMHAKRRAEKANGQ